MARVAQIDDEELAEYAEAQKRLTELRASVRKTMGLYATEKVFSECPKCRRQCGVRELRRHKRFGCGTVKSA